MQLYEILMAQFHVSFLNKLPAGWHVGEVSRGFGSDAMQFACKG